MHILNLHSGAAVGQDKLPKWLNGQDEYDEYYGEECDTTEDGTEDDGPRFGGEAFWVVWGSIYRGWIRHVECSHGRVVGMILPIRRVDDTAPLTERHAEVDIGWVINGDHSRRRYSKAKTVIHLVQSKDLQKVHSRKE